MKTNQFNLFSALFLTSLLPFGAERLFPKIAIALFLISFISELFLYKKWRTFHFDLKTLYFLTMLLFFFLGPIYYFFNSTTSYFQVMMEQRVPLLLFGIIGLFGYNHLYKFSYFLNVLIFSSVAYILFLIFKVGLIEYITSPVRNDLFTGIRIALINSHMKFNLFLNLGLFSAGYLLIHQWEVLKNYLRLIYIIAGCIIIFSLLNTEGRTGFIGCILVITAISALGCWKLNKRILLFAFLIIPIVGFSLISHHKRMSKDVVSTEPRLFLWKEVALPLIKEKPLLGYGISQAQILETKTRLEKQPKIYFSYFAEGARVDVHNQYLQTTVEFGLFGLIILLLLYLAPIFLVDKGRRYFIVICISLFIWQSVFDLFIVGDFGVMFGLIVTVLLFSNNDLIQLNEKPELSV
jgi:O-antigen ligase